MVCKECGKTPSEIQEYIDSAEEEGITPDEFVAQEEGTYNEITGAFWCTKCYVKLGMPLGTA